MIIEKIFNSSIEDINKKHFNILIPICVGNKFFLNGVEPTENISKYITWALKNTKNKILILIADKIQISNWIVRNSRVTPEQNMRRLMRRGEKIKENILKLIEIIPENKQDKIKVLRWEDYYEEDFYCKKTTEVIYNEFRNNQEFKKNVFESVKNSIKDKSFSEEEYLTLCNYVLDEFSVVYHGVKINEDYYGLYAYPESDEVLELIENIKIQKIFPNLENKFPEQKIAVVLMK